MVNARELSWAVAGLFVGYLGLLIADLVSGRWPMGVRAWLRFLLPGPLCFGFFRFVPTDAFLVLPTLSFMIGGVGFCLQRMRHEPTTARLMVMLGAMALPVLVFVPVGVERHMRIVWASYENACSRAFIVPEANAPLPPEIRTLCECVGEKMGIRSCRKLTVLWRFQETALCIEGIVKEAETNKDPESTLIAHQEACVSAQPPAQAQALRASFRARMVERETEGLSQQHQRAGTLTEPQKKYNRCFIGEYLARCPDTSLQVFTACSEQLDPSRLVQSRAQCQPILGPPMKLVPVGMPAIRE